MRTARILFFLLLPVTVFAQPTTSESLDEIINRDIGGHGAELRRYYENADSDRKLYLAVLANDIPLAEEQVTQHNANINTKHGSDEVTLLQIAVMQGNMEMATLLLKHHANPNIVNRQGETALHIVAHTFYEKCPEYSKLMINAGADRDLRNSKGQLASDIARIKQINCGID